MDQKIQRFIELVKQSPIATEKFIQHCIGVFNFLKEKNCSEEVCFAGLYHSIYGTSYFDVTVQNIQNDRDIIQNEIGDYAESLVYEMCILKDREHDILSGLVNYELEFFKDIVTICLANLIELEHSHGSNEDSRRLIFEYQFLLNSLIKGLNPFQLKSSVSDNILVFDNYLTHQDREHLWYFVTHSNFQYGHRSGSFLLDERSLRYSCYLDRKEVFNTRLLPVFEGISKELGQDIFIGGYYIGNYNLSTVAESHLDTTVEDCITILVYPNLRWDESWGGDIKFYTEENNPINKCIDFVPGRIIVFDSKLKHKVMPLSSKSDSNRFSFAFKCCTHKGLHKFLLHYTPDKIIHISST